MSDFKSSSEQKNKTATPVQAPEEGLSQGEMEYVDSRASTFQLIQLQAAADDQGKRNRITQLQSKAALSISSSRIAQLQAKSDSRISSTQSPVVQREENKTGLPDGLKSGMESISGLSLNDVKVHRNSDKPAQLQAHAYAQGTDIHLAPGQEKHLPHELGHVVQQKEGRVKPTTQLKSTIPINDDQSLEQEADVMGAKALHLGGQEMAPLQAMRKKESTNDSSGIVKPIAQLEKAHSKAAEVNPVPDAAKVEDRAAGIGDPLQHPLFPSFKNRLESLFAEFPNPTFDVNSQAELIWANMVDAVHATEVANKNPDLFKPNGYEIKKLDGVHFKAILSAFDTVVNQLKPAASSQFVRAKSFGFWSKAGIHMAKKHADLALETSGLGSLFDGFPSMITNGAKDWDFRIWPALSKGYAECVVDEIIKGGKTIEVFTGGPIVEGNIWEKIESVALKKGLEGVGRTMEEVTTYHAVANVEKNEKSPIDEVQNGGDFPGTWISTKDRGTMLETLKIRWEALPTK